MRANNKKLMAFFVNITCFICFVVVIPHLSCAASDPFPPYEDAPALTSYVFGGTFNNTYYIAPTGNDSTGTGAIGSPWATVNGARTGGAGSAVAAGDLVYFRGGTYIATEIDTSWRFGYYYFSTDGTASNHIVFSAYPGETPVFEATGEERANISLRADYIVVDGLTFTSGGLTIAVGTHCVVQNCTFDGNPHDLPGGQMNDGHLYLYDAAHHTTIRNSYFDSYNAHAIKTYSSSNPPTDLIIEYNRFYTGEVSYGLVSFKAAIKDYIIRYNRFENVSRDAITIGASYSGSHNGIDIYQNAFDGCTNSILTKLGTASTGQVLDLNFYSNVIYNASSGDRDMLELDCGDGCLSGAISRLGEFYNNIFYNLVDVIDPEATSDFTNYPSSFNYNAYPSTEAKNTAENQNNESSSVWQRDALVQSSHGITRTGVAGNRFYTIEDNSPFVGVGREGSNIGGFEFFGRSGGVALNPPSGFQIAL